MTKKARGTRHRGTSPGRPKPRRSSAQAVEVGERVYLRFPTAGDRKELIALKRASRAHLAPWESSPIGGGDMFGQWWFNRFLKSSRTDRSRRLLVCLRETDLIIGQIGLGEIVRGAFQNCYLGYWIGRDFTRQGLMTEAVALALRHAFQTLKLHRIEANIIPRNRASIALARKLGFRFEGTAKRYLRIADRWQDHERWAMTCEEWKPPAPKRLKRP